MKNCNLCLKSQIFYSKFQFKNYKSQYFLKISNFSFKIVHFAFLQSRNTVGSAPSSPKNQRSNSVTPGVQQPNKMSMSLTGTLESNKENGSIMSQSVEGPKSMTGSYIGFASSPAKTQSNCSTLDRK